MALDKPPLDRVSAGRPVTAQGWNAIVDGLSALYDAVLALGTGAVPVSITFDGEPVPDAHVVAEPLTGGTGSPLVAVAPFGGGTSHLLVGVGDGNWRIHVQAAGFRPELRDIVVPLADALVITLTRAGVIVPDLFGQPAQQALSTLGGVGLEVDLILDATGHEVSRVTLPPTYQNAPVLVQIPEAGAVIDAATQPRPVGDCSCAAARGDGDRAEPRRSHLRRGGHRARPAGAHGRQDHHAQHPHPELGAAHVSDTSSSPFGRLIRPIVLPGFRRPAAASGEAAPVFIELGESSKKALIARDGVSIPVVKTLPDELDDLLAGGELIVFKVVSQSVAAGTVVPRGTAVDLVFAPPRRVPLRIFDGVHLELADQRAEQVFGTFIRDDAEVRNLLARNDSADTLSERDKSVLIQRAASQGMTLDERPGTNLAGLFGALQAASTFGV